MRQLLFAAIALALLASACSGGGSKPSATTAPARSPSSSSSEPAASPVVAGTDSISGTKVQDLTVGPPVSLPEGYVFFEVQPLWEGPSEAVRRAYRQPNGIIRVDVLYETKLVFSGSERPTGPAISSVAAIPNGGVLAIGVCQGFCYGETGPISVVSSTDGGMSWSEFGRAQTNSWVVGVGSQLILLGTQGGVDALPRGGTQTRLATSPNGQPHRVLVPSDPPLVLLRGSDGVTLNRPDGTVYTRLLLPRGAQVEAFTPTPAGEPDREVSEIDWSTPGQPLDTAPIRYTGFMDTPSGTFRAVYRWDPTLYVGPSAGLWLTASREVRMVAFPIALFGDRFADRGGDDVYLPAVVDFQGGTVSPILEHFADKIHGAKSGSPIVLAVAKGPFARVNTGGDCLNVRADPAASARSLGCFVDGVLLRDLGETTVVDGRTWVKVFTPTPPNDWVGQAGWAAAEFLQR